MKRLLSIGLFALALTAGTANAGQIFVRIGPPPPPREVIVVRPSPRHVWIPGYYDYRRGRYHWCRGYWAMPPRPRAVWVPGYWEPGRHGHVWISGYWRF